MDVKVPKVQSDRNCEATRVTKVDSSDESAVSISPSSAVRPALEMESRIAGEIQDYSRFEIRDSRGIGKGGNPPLLSQGSEGKCKSHPNPGSPSRSAVSSASLRLRCTYSTGCTQVLQVTSHIARDCCLFLFQIA